MRARPARRRGWCTVRAPALVLSILVATHGLAGAGQTDRAGWCPCPPPSSQPSYQHEVLTLDEAARLLRIEPWELEHLALRRSMPARLVGSQWRFSRTALFAWIAGMEKHAPSAAAMPAPGSPGTPAMASPLTDETLLAVRGRGSTAAGGQTEAEEPRVAQSETSEAPAEPTDDEPEPIGEAPEERGPRVAFLRAQNVLLAPGELTLEPALFYARGDGQTLALVGAGAGLATVETDTATALLVGRYGVLKETEVFASASYIHARTSVFFGSREIASDARTEFGDVGLGLRRTVLREGPGMPDIILSVNGRLPTGESSYAIGGGIALVKSIDPVVLFANANYQHVFAREFEDLTRLEAADRVSASVGYGLALNDTLTLSTAVSGLFTGATSFDIAELRQRERYFLQFGLTSYLAKGLYIEPTVSFGLNDLGNSVAFGLSLPYTFKP